MFDTLGPPQYLRAITLKRNCDIVRYCVDSVDELSLVSPVCTLMCDCQEDESAVHLCPPGTCQRTGRGTRSGPGNRQPRCVQQLLLTK